MAVKQATSRSSGKLAGLVDWLGGLPQRKTRALQDDAIDQSFNSIDQQSDEIRQTVRRLHPRQRGWMQLNEDDIQERVEEQLAASQPLRKAPGEAKP